MRVLADSSHQHRGSPRDLTSPEASSPSADLGDIAGDLMASPVDGGGGLASPSGRVRGPVEAVSLWSDDLWDDALMADVERIEREARESAAAAGRAAAEGGEEAEDMPGDLFDFDGDDIVVGAAADSPQALASTLPAVPSSSSSSVPSEASFAAPEAETETEPGPEAAAEAGVDMTGSEPETQPQVVEGPELEIELEASDAEDDE